jgi:predicted nucleic acid-binding protein
VKIIVDANIVFSGILNSNGKIGDILINSKGVFDFVAPEFLRLEIRKYYSKLSTISGMNLTQILEAEFQICKDITFFSHEQIPDSIWLASEKLVADVDAKDVHYIAYSKYLRCKIWSGDKKLIKGLAKKGFLKFISTDDLFKVKSTL